MSICPDEGTLRAYLDGEDDYGGVTAHLAGCARCPAILAALRSEADQARAAVTALDAVSEPATTAAWRRFQARAEQPAHPSLKRRLQDMKYDLRYRALRPALAATALVALALSLAFVAPLRGAAAQFLGIFRAQQIRVVLFDSERLRELSAYPGGLFTDVTLEQPEVVAASGPEEATLLAGYRVLAPNYLPEGISDAAVLMVTPQRQARARADLAVARAMLVAAGLPTDALPGDPDEQRPVIFATIPPQVSATYGQGPTQLAIHQLGSPQVEVPEGLDLPRLGQYGLQLLGLSPEEAARLSRQVDWTTTLVLPIPADVASAREISLRGTTGYLLQGADDEGREQVMVLWEENEILYAVTGAIPAEEALRVAESLR